LENEATSAFHRSRRTLPKKDSSCSLGAGNQFPDAGSIFHGNPGRNRECLALARHNAGPVGWHNGRPKRSIRDFFIRKEFQMPLHDWTDLPGWEGVHQIWMVELLYWLQPRLPAGYRAYIGTTPTFAIDAPAADRPDVGVRNWSVDEKTTASPSGGDPEEPDQEVAVATLAGDKALFVERAGRLVAALELVSPRNKDRPSACAAYANSYLGYLLKGVNLLLVDVHRRPLHFSFADRIAEELHVDQPACPPPFAVSYRVGEPAPGGGRFLGTWRRSLSVGEALPSLPLALSVHESVPVDLEAAYARAAAAAYLD
jgi:hypothetical protein